MKDRADLPEPRSSIHRYFAGMAENTFQSQLGVVDPPLIDYLTSLLIRSIRNDRVHRVRGVTGRPLMTIQEMVNEAAARLGEARRDLHRHIGDFTLFWAGIYPESLRGSEIDSTGQFETYCTFGKRSYRIASAIESEDDNPPAEVLERLSDRYDLCCYGLREVRRQWEHHDDDDFGPGSILLN